MLSNWSADCSMNACGRRDRHHFKRVQKIVARAQNSPNGYFFAVFSKKGLAFNVDRAIIKTVKKSRR